MNHGFIRYILFKVVLFAGGFFILPAVVAAIYKERDGVCFLLLSLLCLLIGSIGGRMKPKSMEYYAKEGFVAVSLAWIVISLIGAIPFSLLGITNNYLDSVFETVSGFTTTGGTILTDVEVLSHSVQFWRLFTHWIGGMGVLVFVMAVLPMSGGYSMHLMKAESPGPSVGKLVPKARFTAAILYQIYVVLTLAAIISLTISGLPVFDSMLLSFSALGTGGFSVLNSGAGSYPVATQVVLTVFMIIGGTNFNLYYLLFIARKPKDVFKLQEVRIYFAWNLVLAGLITLNVFRMYDSVGMAFKDAIFQVASISSTTGLSTLDYEVWPQFSKVLLFIATLVGACAGSTGGGFKVSRILILIEDAKNELVRVVHPHAVKKVHLEGRATDDGLVKSVQTYLAIYVGIFTISFVFLSIDRFDFVTNITAVAANLNNVGPGLNVVGPAGNYAGYSAFSKIVLIFDMLAGRLELLPILILFNPGTWKKY